MQTQKYRFPLLVLKSICLLLLLQQCAWICGKKDVSELIKPRPIGGYEALSTRIHYPRNIRNAGIEGTVIVKALISVDGQVKQVQMVKSLNPDLDQIVTNAIKRTPFEPATRAGKPEEVWISIPFVFAFNDWSSKNTPFTDFRMTIYPDAAYKNFEVEIEGHLKTGLEWPLYFECLLPFNASSPWVQGSSGRSHETEVVRDDKGEWLIFQLSSQDLAIGFSYKTMVNPLNQKFLYEFTMNQALPDWVFSVVYGNQSVHFAKTPDRIITRDNGATQFEYDISAQDSYESRYLEIGLQQ